MKKVILFFAGMLFVGVAATFAQVDTTATPTPAPTPPAQSENAVTPPQGGMTTKDMVKIKDADLPDNLRTTLQGAEYKGWEKGKIYRSKNSDGYVIEMKDGKSHRFDATGKPVQ